MVRLKLVTRTAVSTDHLSVVSPDSLSLEDDSPVIIDSALLTPETVEKLGHGKRILYLTSSDPERLALAFRSGFSDCIPDLNEETIKALQERIGESRKKSVDELYTPSRQMFLKDDYNVMEATKAPLEDTNNKYRMHLHEGLFRIIILKYDRKEAIMELLDNDEYLDRIILVIDKELSDFCYDIVYDKMPDGVLALLNYSNEEIENTDNALQVLLHHARLEFQDEKRLDLTLCMSREYESIKHLHEAKYEALDARWARIYLGPGKTIALSSESASAERQEYLSWLTDKICHSFETFNLAETRKNLGLFFQLNLDVQRVRDSRVFIRTLLDRIFDFYMQVMIDKEEARKLKHEVLYRTHMINSEAELQEMLDSMLGHMLTGILSETAQKYPKPVEKALLYIKEDCLNASLETIADKVRVTPAYLSYLFHKETGQHFSELVKNEKITQAKRLLRDTKMNISEVASSMQYDRVQNFSKFFKKHTGLTPKEYRKLYS